MNNLEQVFLNLIIISSFLTTALLGLGAIFKISEISHKRILNLGIFLNLLAVCFTAYFYIFNHFRPFETQPLKIFQSGDYDFTFSFYLDSVSFVFLMIVTLFGNIISYFSQRYMHREEGFRRFFFVTSLFLSGMDLAILGSNLDTLFAGWELVGVSSYLLIAFYWERDKPVQNAQRVYLVYRICDLGLLLGALFAHTVWRVSSLFPEIGKATHLEGLVRSLPLLSQWLMGGLIALAALGKSAQFPFLTWLPRALEGPTPSSAIFYGALSIHLGVYLLMRLEPIWNLIPGFALFLGTIGLLSAFLASAFGRLQTTIKGQIAYASSAQVGMMFLELALGFNRLVLLHFVGNALLRGYQLLTAPSIVSDQLRFHSAHGGIIYRSRWLPEIILPNRLVELSFLFCLNEGYIDAISERIVQAVLNFLGWVTSILFPLWRPNREYKSSRTLIIFSLISTLIMCATGLGLVLKITAIAYLLLIVSVLFAILAFQEISNPFATLFFVFISQICPVLAASLLDSHAARELAFYTISIATGLAFATFSLGRISRDRKWKDAFRINGLVKTYPNTASLFFFTSISMVGFPLTFTFIGEDLLFHHLVPHSMIGAASVCFNYVLNGFTIIRMFGNIFLGKSRKSVSIENFGLTPNHALWAFCTFLFLQVVPLIFWRYYGI